MVRRDLRGLTRQQLEEWSIGRPIAEVVEEMGGIGPGRAVLMATLPKNGSFNRCSVCRTALTSATMTARAVTIEMPSGEEWSCMVLVCSPRCGGRLL